MKKHIVLLNTLTNLVRRFRRQFSAKGLIVVFSCLGFFLALLLAQFTVGFSGCFMGICHNSAVGQAAVSSQILYISPQGSGNHDGSSA